MRPFISLGPTFGIASLFAIGGCEIATGEVTQEAPTSTDAQVATAPPPPVSEGGVPDARRPPPQTVAPMGAAAQLMTGLVSISGVTSDSWVVVRVGDALRAVTLPVDMATKDITTGAGNVLIRGRVVFDWKDVDWKTNTGALSVWTSGAGTHEIGMTAYAEALVAASEQGRTIVYTANAKGETMDLMIAPADFSTRHVLIAHIGRGSETTCGPSFNFVGERLFVGWCAAGSRTGIIERYEEVAGEWTPTLMAKDALPAWSSSTSGERVFYQSSTYSGRYAEKGKTYPIDTGVSGGFLLPDGSAALYTVGDQLRRTPIPAVAPLTIVTRGYAQVAEFTKTFDRALYSSTVTYDNGTRRDLRIIRTDEYNQKPVELVQDPVAGLPRSALTNDGQFVLYLTDATPSGAMLHIRSVDGSERMTLPNVLDAVAAHDGTIVFTDGSSDPEKYPIVADLKMLDLATNDPAVLVEAKISEPRNFHVDASGRHVVYVRSGVDRDADAGPLREGLFVRTIP
jgi:hypothetical protein